MPGDYTRLRFNPTRNVATLLQQQGRVMLDQDWNELAQVIDRRWRAETVDTIGNAVVPRKETPHGFEILPVVVGAGYDLTIGPGRIYVDGLLAENHGALPHNNYDTVLDELSSQTPVTFENQPFFPKGMTPPPIPFVLPGSGAPFVVYLDVWQREVTWLQEPLLVDVAVGVDTTTRVQTAWQVKVLPNTGTTTCGTPDDQVPGWGAVTARSGGELTTQAAGVPQNNDPCTIPANKGYRGTENRTYRVEIHTPGPLGTAQFKWSRNNASYGSPVTAIDSSNSVLTVIRTKRDSVLRFSQGDWVEITDDTHEFAGLSGEMHQIKSVDNTNLTVTLQDTLTGPFDATDPSRHTRMILWDEAGAVYDNNNNLIVNVDTNGGVIPVNANTTVVLEDGVWVTFNLTAKIGNFQVGDYWTFTARVADGSVEKLTNAPPRGLHHHYCRLATVTFPGTYASCRTFWPPDFGEDCECAACVTAAEHNAGTFTIQMAIDQAKTTGGKVCLGPGDYTLTDTINIIGAKYLRISGHGLSRLLMAPQNPKKPKPGILVSSCQEITIEQISIAGVAFGQPNAAGVIEVPPPPATPPAPAPASFATTTTTGTVGIVQGDVGGCAALMIQDSLEITVQNCSFAVDVLSFNFTKEDVFPAYQAIGLGGYVIGLMIRENILQAVTFDLKPIAIGGGGIFHLPTVAVREAEPVALLVLAGVQIRDNLFLCGGAGIDLSAFGEDFVQQCLYLDEVGISGNDFLICIDAGIRVGGFQIPGLVSTRVDIKSNNMSVIGSGVQTNLSFARISNNDVTPFLSFSSGTGVYLYPPPAGLTMDGVEIVGNRIRGVGGAGINITTPIVEGAIVDNLIEGARQGGIMMGQSASADHLTIAQNALDGLIPVAADVANASVAAGIYLLNVNYAEIEGNAIRNFAMDATGNTPRVGIYISSSKSVVVTDNQLVTIGPDAAISPSAGIAVFNLLNRADLSDNVVRRGESPTTAQDLNSQWRAVYIGPQDYFAGQFYRTVAGTQNQTFFVTETSITSTAAASVQTVSVRGNLLEAFGGSSAVEVNIAGQLIFSENDCRLYTRSDTPAAELETQAQMIASNNALTSPKLSLLISVGVNSQKQPNCTVLGNISTGLIEVNGAALAAPWAPLNIMI
jgi:hypothetical protein